MIFTVFFLGTFDKTRKNCIIDSAKKRGDIMDYISSKEKLEILVWNSTHYNDTNAYKPQFEDLMKKQTKAEVSHSMQQISLATIKQVVENNQAIEEYCSKYGNSPTNLRMVAQIIKDNHPKLYEQFVNLFHEPSEEFYTYIRWIASIMLTKGNAFDVFDYYYYTKLHPLTFITICKKIMKPEICNKLNPIINTIRSYGRIKVNIEVELSGRTIIKNKEITRQEKEKVLRFLEENNMPYVTFKAALRKYVEEDERIMNYLKQPIKQKMKRGIQG